MTNYSSKLFPTALALVALVAFTCSPVAEAARGGGGGGGGANRASAGSGGGGNRAAGAQANNVNADKRTNEVRNVNNNNVNVNKNVNVNVEGGGCCNNGWDNDYHPVARAAAVGATVAVTSAVIGSMVNTVPPNCVPVNYSGMVYQQCGTTWYQSQGPQYIVVNPPY
jgi:hypothetical protein